MAETILELVLRAHDQPQGARDLGSNVDQINDLANYFHKLAAGGCKASSLVIRQNAVAATGTVTCASVAGADTVTLGGVVFTATQRHATATVTLTSIAANETVTVNGVVFTAVNGGTPTAVQFDMSGNDAADATALAAAVNASTHASISGILTATASSNVVTFRAVATGTSGNSLTLASSTETVSGATFSGGAATTTSTFDYTGTNTQTGAYLAAAINSHATTSVQFSASAAAGVVTITSLVPGVIGNALSLASSNGTRLAVSAANLSGGTDGTKQTLTL